MERWRALAAFAGDVGSGSCLGEGNAWWIAEWGKVRNASRRRSKRTKIALSGVKKKNISGMALYAREWFFWGRRWTVGRTAAILHNALIGRLWMRPPHEAWQQGSFVRQYYKVHYVNIAWGSVIFKMCREIYYI